MAISISDLRIASDWLDCNEGLNGEREACTRVAAWIDREIERREDESFIGKLQREHHVSRRHAKGVLAGLKAQGER